MIRKSSITMLLAATLVTQPLLAQSGNIIRSAGGSTLASPPAVNWVDVDPTYTDWLSGNPYGCSSWLPDPAGYTESASFVQSSAGCSIDQTRERQARQQDTYSLAYRNVGDPVTEEYTLVNQSAERDYQIQYSTWAASADPYGCTNWSPSEDTYPAGISFTQIANDCQLDQTRARTETSRFLNGGWVQEALRSETRTVANQAHARTAVGTAQIPTLTLTGPATEVFVSEVFGLSWAVTNQNQLWISGSSDASGVGTAPASVSGTQKNITPTAVGNYTYKLKAENNAGQSQEKSVGVSVVAAPKVLTFVSDKAQVALNADFTLSWTDSGSGSLSLDNGIGSVSGTSKLLNAGASPGIKTYTLTTSRTLNGVTKQDSKSVLVDVLNNPTVAISNASGTNVVVNTDFTLSWTASGANNFKIRGSAAASGVATTDEDRGTSSSITIRPTAVGTYTYTVTASNAVGVTAVATHTVNVIAPGPVCQYVSNSTYWLSYAQLMPVGGYFRMHQVYYNGSLIFNDGRPVSVPPVTSFSYGGKTWTIGEKVTTDKWKVCSQ